MIFIAPQIIYPPNRHTFYNMTSLVTKLLSDLAGSAAAKVEVPTEAQPGVFYIRPSPQDTSILLVHVSGQTIASKPLYIIKTTKKHLEYHRVGDDGQNVLIGEATVHQWNSSSADITLNGRPINMKISSSSGHTKFESPLLGRVQWKVDYNTGSGLTLVDEHKQKIAKYGSASHIPGIRGKKLEILVPADPAKVEEIVWAAVVAKGVNKAADEAASKVLKAFVI